MKYRFMTVSGALALGLILLCGAVSFAHTTKKVITKPAMNSSSLATMGNGRDEHRRRRHHRHHHHRRHMQR